MLDELFLIKGVKVSGHCLGKDWAHLLSAHLGSALELEALIRLHVRSLTLKPMGLVLGEAYHNGALAALSNRLKHLIVLSQFPLLFLREILLV